MNPVEAAMHAQAAVVLRALDEYLRAAPGRSIELTHDFDGGFAVRLHEEHVSRGETLVDAASQVAQVLVLEGP